MTRSQRISVDVRFRVRVEESGLCTIQHGAHAWGIGEAEDAPAIEGALAWEDSPQ